MAYQPVEPEISDQLMCKRLVTFRDEFNLTKTAMAKALNIPYNTYVLWEKGSIRVQHKTILLLALAALWMRYDIEEETDGEQKKKEEKTEGS